MRRSSSTARKRLNCWLTGQELEIATAFEELNGTEHEDVKAIIFRGEGRSFSSGYDVTELGTQYWEDGEDTKSRPSQRRRLHVDAQGRNVLRAVFQSRKAVIGELKGYVLGGAFEFVLGCDILIAAEGTVNGSPPARMVAAAGMSSAFSILRLGPALYSEMMLLGRFISAEEGYERGLINRVVPLEDLEDTTQAAADLASLIPADGIAIHKLQSRLAYNTLGFESALAASNMSHTLQVQQRLGEHDWKPLHGAPRPRREGGVPAARSALPRRRRALQPARAHHLAVSSQADATARRCEQRPRGLERSEVSDDVNGRAVGAARGQNTRLSDVVAVELGGGLAAAYCGRWLRLHGATVIKIEDATTDGDRLRREDPDAGRLAPLEPPLDVRRPPRRQGERLARLRQRRGPVRAARPALPRERRDLQLHARPSCWSAG